MSDAVSITKPTVGMVTITLPYDEAEVLTRAVGMINQGNLQEHAPTLVKVMDDLLAEFGRSIDKEARSLYIYAANSQWYVGKYDEPLVERIDTNVWD